ncbi:hypothetical protein KUC_0916 [Vreelandella boliviensis LC1]|uniref:PH domain-containing protein n=1 Tax=Vreelandella boliviensis LC1 TaxID=1072583 RepID=A0A265DZ78_9GAMM|nr:hypothetical protein KUC_0916 [Halomonas boliviensis LC1]OZT74617.1 hypothetical protein CE457_08630 [Halomonas boliviensis LC1]
MEFTVAVYGGIQAHELERWLNALTNAAYDRRCPLSKVHGGDARARTARQDLLHLAHDYRRGESSREESATALGRWCQTYLSEAEWYVLVGTRQAPSQPQSEETLSEEERSLAVLKQHRVG